MVLKKIEKTGRHESVISPGFSLAMGTIGIEPMTSCMSSMRSNQLGYAPKVHLIIAHRKGKCNPILKKVKKSLKGLKCKGAQIPHSAYFFPFHPVISSRMAKSSGLVSRVIPVRSPNCKRSYEVRFCSQTGKLLPFGFPSCMKESR